MSGAAPCTRVLGDDPTELGERMLITDRVAGGAYRPSSPPSALQAAIRATTDLGSSGAAMPTAAELNGMRAHPGATESPSTPSISSTRPSRAMPAAESVISELVSVYSDGAETEMPGWRREMISAQIRRTGGYEHFPGELIWGARVAWRNYAGCVGTEHWRALRVQDCRDRRDAKSVFAAIVEFLASTFNGGSVLPSMVVFGSNRPRRPAPQILNRQIISYAGYLLRDGSILGDPANVGVTRTAASLGWSVDRRTAFDVLPIMIQIGKETPELFTFPGDVAHEVPIIHPHLPIEQLGLRCSAFSALSMMSLEIGGLTYPAAPVSRPYTCREVTGRIMATGHTSDVLASMAQVIGLPTSDRRSWGERARTELETAVLHSFTAAGVRLIDHEAFCPLAVPPVEGAGRVRPDQPVIETSQASTACVLTVPDQGLPADPTAVGPRLIAQRAA